MANIPVEIILQGLIALVPIHGRSGIDYMTALLVDGRQPPGEASDCVKDHAADHTAMHHAAIRFSTQSRECTDVQECSMKSGRCTCDLDRMEISIIPSPSPPPPATSNLREPTRPPILPFDNSRGSAGSFENIPSLNLLGQRLNQDFLAVSPPSALVGRFQFPVESLLACNLSTRPDDRTANVHPLQFRKVGAEPQSGDLTQAGAQKLVAKFTLSLPDEPVMVPKLRLRSFDGSVSHEFELLGSRLRIEVLNHRPELLPVDDPCDDGVGRDFAFFYDLVESPPAWKDRKVPHVKFTVLKSLTDVDPPDCEPYKAPMSRPICPMASINP